MAHPFGHARLHAVIPATSDGIDVADSGRLKTLDSNTLPDVGDSVRSDAPDGIRRTRERRLVR